MNRYSAFAVSFLVVSCWSAMAGAQPSISSLTPAVLPPGKTTEVTIHGGKLDRPLQVWASFPAEVELIAPANEEEAKKVDAVRCRITPAAGISVGVAGIALGNKSGSSGIHFFVIDDLPSLLDNGDNHSTEKAQLVTLPTSVTGTIDGSHRDYYAFEAAKGQRVAVEVLASRLGSTMDPVVLGNYVEAELELGSAQRDAALARTRDDLATVVRGHHGRHVRCLGLDIHHQAEFRRHRCARVTGRGGCSVSSRATLEHSAGRINPYKP
ncbi:MAG: IPT/TIG domain-containing protein, partial [Pirellulaceae bacterium]|nr:IPT/TIG domain-containing protein [Pirellulaceae bacterium]